LGASGVTATGERAGIAVRVARGSGVLATAAVTVIARVGGMRLAGRCVGTGTTVVVGARPIRVAERGKVPTMRGVRVAVGTDVKVGKRRPKGVVVIGGAGVKVVVAVAVWVVVGV